MSENVKCPLCGAVNTGVNMDETDGWLECSSCRAVVQLLKYVTSREVPLYQMDKSQILIPLSRRRKSG